MDHIRSTEVSNMPKVDLLFDPIEETNNQTR
jgi:hypothetical protein